MCVYIIGYPRGLQKFINDSHSSVDRNCLKH